METTSLPDHLFQANQEQTPAQMAQDAARFFTLAETTKTQVFGKLHGVALIIDGIKTEYTPEQREDFITQLTELWTRDINAVPEVGIYFTPLAPVSRFELRSLDE